MSVIRTPLSDLFTPIIPNMTNKRCREFQLNMMECFEVYGYPVGGDKCKNEKDDFYECIYGYKQVQRYQAMRKERVYQVLRGERNWRDLFSDPPKLDSYEEVYGSPQ